MMITTLGPRHVHWRDRKGGSGVITISIEGQPDHVTDLGEGAIHRSIKAQVHIRSAWQDRTMYALGEDDIQVLFWLLNFTSIYLEQMCRDCEIELTDYNTPLTTVTDFAVFRSITLD